jgi:hypothetical protein
MTDRWISSRDHLWVTHEICDFSQLIITERMATKEELARIREELEKIDAECSKPTRAGFIGLAQRPRSLRRQTVELLIATTRSER